MTSETVRILRRSSRPMAPIRTDLAPALARLPVRAVLLDLYGTLFVAAGDGRPDGRPAATAFRDAFAAVGLAVEPEDVQVFATEIARHQARRRLAGADWPEVDIESVWSDTAAALRRLGRIGAEPTPFELRRLAVEYESRANPAWPMPGLRRCLRALRRRHLELGMVSNCQFYSLELFPALLGKTATELGFDPHLHFLSYALGRAKPSPVLYELAARALADRGIAPQDVLYVGNDMTNDVRPAAARGFRTALFAGDARSLRRGDDPGLPDPPPPDLVLTELTQLPACLTAGRRRAN